MRGESATAGCPREDDLLEALRRGYLAPDLREHVASCGACRELHLVAGALLDDRADAAAAPVPSAGAVWWRMRLRHRSEARAAARRVLVVGQALSFLGAIALLATLFGGEVTAGVRGMLLALRFGPLPLLALGGLLLLLAPVGGWLALRGK